MSKGTPISITGIFHPLGWGCGFACDSDPSIYNPIIPNDGCCHCDCGDDSDDGDEMRYHGIVRSLDDITFTPRNGDIVQVADGSGNLIEYIYTDHGWDVMGEVPLIEGDGIDIEGNRISVRVQDDTTITKDEDGIGTVWGQWEGRE